MAINHFQARRGLGCRPRIFLPSKQWGKIVVQIKALCRFPQCSVVICCRKVSPPLLAPKCINKIMIFIVMQIFAIQEAPLLFLCYSNCLNFIMKQDYHPDNVRREGKWAMEMSIGAFQNRPSYCLRVVAFCTFFLS